MGRFWGLVLCLAFAGCSVNKTAFSTGGSRADGTIDMTYDWGAFETPKMDWVSAQVEAERRCAVWGYKGAERFGGESRKCTIMDPNGICGRWEATVTYQCFGTQAAAQQ